MGATSVAIWVDGASVVVVVVVEMDTAVGGSVWGASRRAAACVGQTKMGGRRTCGGGAHSWSLPFPFPLPFKLVTELRFFVPYQQKERQMSESRHFILPPKTCPDDNEDDEPCHSLSYP